MYQIQMISIAILVIFVLHSINATPSEILSDVTGFEYRTIPKAPMRGSKPCMEFHRGIRHEFGPEFDDADYLKIDCERYRRTLACYQDIQKKAGTSTTDGKPAEKDLSKDARVRIERACGL